MDPDAQRPPRWERGEGQESPAIAWLRGFQTGQSYYASSPVASLATGSEAGASGWPEKVQTLLDAALELSGEHELDTVLRRIVAGAASIAEARYAALGIYDATGTIESFIHHGMDDATVKSIGTLPHGVGLLGEVIVARGPIRLENLGADPRAGGFPPEHPPMRSFLGVPVARGSQRYGNLYLTEREDGLPFDDEGEALVVAFAALAAAAIESARLVQAERGRAEAVAALAAATERAAVNRRMLAEILNAQELERTRVSRDLHDDVGQALTSVLLALRLVESSLDGDDVVDARRHTADVRELVADALGRARRLPSTCGRRSSTTSAWSPPWSAWPRTSTPVATSRSSWPAKASPGPDWPPASRPWSTASFRRR